MTIHLAGGYDNCLSDLMPGPFGPKYWIHLRGLRFSLAELDKFTVAIQKDVYLKIGNLFGTCIAGTMFMGTKKKESKIQFFNKSSAFGYPIKWQRILVFLCIRVKTPKVVRIYTNNDPCLFHFAEYAGSLAKTSPLQGRRNKGFTMFGHEETPTPLFPVQHSRSRPIK